MNSQAVMCRSRRAVYLLMLALLLAPLSSYALKLTLSITPTLTGTSPATVTRDDSSPTNAITVTVSSSDTNIAAPSTSSVIIPSFSFSSSFSILKLATGTVTITASSPGYTSAVVNLTINSVNFTSASDSDAPGMAVDGNNRPVVVYAAANALGIDQIYAKRWSGEDPLDTYGSWFEMTNDWQALAGSLSGSGVSGSGAEAREPSVGISGSKIFVAWTQVDPFSNTLSHVALKYYNGSSWSGLGNSEGGWGIYSNAQFSATKPAVIAALDGWPIVAWKQSFTSDTRVLVAKWDPLALKWIGYGSSLTSGVPRSSPYVSSGPAITLDSSGNPVVAWQDFNASQHIVIYQWNGTSWVSLGTVGTEFYAKDPKLGLGADGLIYMTWVEAPNYLSQESAQVYVRRYSGGSWQEVGGSGTYGGLSSTSLLYWAFAPSITMSRQTNAYVAWQAGSNNNNSIWVKSWKPGDTSWSAVAGAGAYPGIVTNGNVLQKPSIGLLGKLPVVCFRAASGTTGVASRVQIFKVGGDSKPPTFAGLCSASTTVGSVTLSWLAASDNSSTTIYYRIFRGPANPCTESDIVTCNDSDVFTNQIAIVTNILSYQDFSAASNFVYCYGVLAMDTNDNTDANNVMLKAGPYACNPIDTNGLPFVWENVQGITNPTNDNDGDGINNSNECINGTDPWSGDTDQDGLTDSNELFVTFTDPVVPDTDLDGLGDGMDPNPLNAESRSSNPNIPLGISDGDAYLLGYGTNMIPTVFSNLLYETFETDVTSLTNRGWRTYKEYGYNLWHLSFADPAMRTNWRVRYLHERSTNRSFRVANDDTAGTNADATYSIPLDNKSIGCALALPVIDARLVSNLFIGFNECYETEADADTVQVQARSSTNRAWVTYGGQRSGVTAVTNPVTGAVTTNWIYRTINLSKLAGTNAYIRFFFASDAKNSEFHGWYVDDVRVFGGGAEIRGWVRDNNGAPIQNAVIDAIGSELVTNVWQGHSYVKPRKSFGLAVSGEDGSYVIQGLPWGRYGVKAGNSSYRFEFYNGPLFAAPYGFGRGLNPGVYDVDLVSAAGWMTLQGFNIQTNSHFELELGSSRAFLNPSVQSSALTNSPIILNAQTQTVWNGSTSAPSFVAYAPSANLGAARNFPDWETNPLKPSLLSDLVGGDYVLGVGGSALPYFPLPSCSLRDGEVFRTRISTNQGRAQIAIRADDNGVYPIWIDGRRTTNSTSASASVLVPVKAGDHTVTLGDTNWIPSMRVVAPMGYRTGVLFRVRSAPSGYVILRSHDLQGNAVTGAQIYVDGRLVAATNTPAIVSGIRPGIHSLTLVKSGFQLSELQSVNVLTNDTVAVNYTLRESDSDFDWVGDATEIQSYTNLFLYSRSNDPDADGLNNLFEFDLYRLFGVRANLFDRDTDHDAMLDGQEVGFDGFTNRYAKSTIYGSLVQGTTSVVTRFVGQYLNGIDNFGSNVVAASVNGDRFQALYVQHPDPAVPTAEPALTVFNGIPPAVLERTIDLGHADGEPIYADTALDVTDTDLDGMWDGFEFAYMNQHNLLNPIESRNADDDPDADEATNLREFLGVDDAANTNDWTNPNEQDTDGDGMPDGWEYKYGLNPRSSADGGQDPDSDGLLNVDEFTHGTDPRLRDTDADGLPDGAEICFQTDPLRYDTDFDGLSDGQEVWDKDLDGNYDGGFFNGILNCPISTDIDDDGNPDGPLDWDTDGDGMPDGFEVMDEFGNIRPEGATLNPYDKSDGKLDSDGDGLLNWQEYAVRNAMYGHPPSEFSSAYANLVWDYSTDPFKFDSDGDGLPDGWEVAHGLHPMDPVPYGDDPTETQTRYDDLGPRGDLDSDGLWNGREYSIRYYLDPHAQSNAVDSLSTDPWVADTDHDGLGDGEEDRSFRTHPIRQDTDSDRLMDGQNVKGKWGEVDSTMRASQYQLVGAIYITNIVGSTTNVTTNTTFTWQQALIAAQVRHPIYSNVIGHLAVLSTPDEAANAYATYFTAGVTNVALGAKNATGRNLLAWSWVNYEYFDWAQLVELLPLSLSNGVENYLVMTNGGYWKAINGTQTVDHFLIEWENIRVRTNDYDRALNDIWMLTWSSLEDLPRWQKIKIFTNSLVPPARWGAAMTYVPVFETKNPDNDKTGVILMDNRKLVLIGGRDGVTKHPDVWEFLIRSNCWTKSIAPLYGGSPGYLYGLSDLSAVPIFGYQNTKRDCDCNDKPYTCGGTAFAEPKDRPRSASRSFDWTYIIGGWDNAYDYHGGWWLYKSTDSRDGVRESVECEDYGEYRYLLSNNVTDYIEFKGAQLMPLGQFAFGPTNFYGTNAFHFSALGGLGRCEQLIRAQLVFEFAENTGSKIDLQIVGELSYGGVSSGDYLDKYPPSTRMQEWPYRTATNSLSVPAGTNKWTIDITDLMQQMISNTNVGWDGSTAGFVVFVTNSTTGYGLLKDNKTHMDVVYIPNYAKDPTWTTPNVYELVNEPYGFDWWLRKSAAMVYDYQRQKLVHFGGMNGETVFDDTHEGVFDFTSNFDPRKITWTRMSPALTPPARWGHSMVYDPVNSRVLMFGGFDANHKPLNDLWAYTPLGTETRSITNSQGSNETITVTNAAAWRQLATFQNTDKPQPRGGAAMVWFGGYDYNRGIANYCVGGHGDKMVLFGGTDGKTYFNDTWVFDEKSHWPPGTTNDGRWILVNPAGEMSKSPSPRAFASIAWAQNARKLPDPMGDSTWQDGGADRVITNDDNVVETISNDKCTQPGAFLFGGRNGTLPTAEDTDSDMVDDGTEYELGGPAAGRDPRINRLVDPMTTSETIPFAFNKIGPMAADQDELARGAVANMESLRNDDGGYAGRRNLPYENHTESDAVVHVMADLDWVGVNAKLPDQLALWWHRYEGADPFDARDVWGLGVPNSTYQGSNGAPPYAHSGRWCFGTGLRDRYPNNATMGLYSPRFSLTVPPPVGTSTNTFNTPYYLVFWEWLDLADPNDFVRIDVLRPGDPASVATREPGTNAPPITILPNRNNENNTTGQWRRVIVPLEKVGNETNLFLRFVLQSDSSGNAGGWYVDDVAIVQGGLISGSFSNTSGVKVVLMGTNANDHVLDSTFADDYGFFQFELLALGSYSLGAVCSNFPVSVSDLNPVANLGSFPVPTLALNAPSSGFGSPFSFSWPAVPGMRYRIEYSQDLFNWYWLADVTAASSLEWYVDYTAVVRMYRVLLLNE